MGNLDRVNQALIDLNSTLQGIEKLIAELIKDKKSTISESDLWYQRDEKKPKHRTWASR